MLLNALSYRSLRNSVCLLRSAYRSLEKPARHSNSLLSKSFHSSSKCTIQMKNPRYTDAMRMNSNVRNNVLLYKNERHRDFFVVRSLFYGWFCLMVIMVFANYNPKFVTTWSKIPTWKEYLTVHGTNFVYFVYALVIGPMACALLYALNHRLIKYVVLHKGGKEVSIYTNHLYKNSHSYMVPVEAVKVPITREKMRYYMPMKIQGRSWFYLLDGQGTFPNGKLFDYTVGRVKSW